MSALVFAMPGNESLARALSSIEHVELGECRIRPFPDGETYLRFLSPVRHRIAAIACTLDRPDDKLVRVYLAARTLRALGARRVLLVAPYLPYMRQDTVFEPGEGINAQHVADLLSGCIDGLVTVDPHLHRIAKLENLYRVPVRVVSAAGPIRDWIHAQVRRPLLVGPDQESAQWVSEIARRLDCAYRVLRKQRYGDRDVQVDATGLDAEPGTTPVLVDDIVSSGHTVVESIKALAAQRLPPPVCVVVHGLFAGQALDRIRHAGAVRVAACNTVAHAAESIHVEGALVAAFEDLLRTLH
jgi:ribose-phosphate pyrophosphokinase